jgi:hypothetical protein
MMNKARLLLPALMLVTILAAGCKGKSAPASITGKVTFKDAPVPGGTVTFRSADGEGPNYKGVIGADGTYTVTDVPVGEMTVTVETESVNTNKKMPTYGGNRGGGVGNPEGEKAGSVSPKPKDAPTSSGAYVAIPPKYSLPTQSGLKFTVENGKNTYNIPLAE